jgi:hypothetical protein
MNHTAIAEATHRGPFVLTVKLGGSRNDRPTAQNPEYEACGGMTIWATPSRSLLPRHCAWLFVRSVKEVISAVHTLRVIAVACAAFCLHYRILKAQAQ